MLLVGYGYWGKVLHRVFQNDILAICEVTRIALSDIKTFTSIKDAIKEYKGPKIAIIATPASTHFDLASVLMQNGYDVWLEKPAASTVQEIDELIKISEKNNRIVFVDHVYCYDDNIKKIKQLNLLDPIYYRSIRLAPGPVRYDVTSIMDLGIHDLSILNFLYPNVELTSKKIKKLNQDHMLIDLEFDNNLNATIECSWSFPIKKRLIVSKYLNNTIVHDSVEKNVLRLYDSELKEIDVFEAKNETLQNAKGHFLDCIKKRKIPKTNLYSAKKIMEWITF
jgi:predicted dehydrogenase